MEISWSKIIFSEKFFKRLDAMARRTIADELIAEEAVTFIIQTLSEDNWQRCRSFTGKSAPETFLFSTCSRLIIDFMRKSYGRTRPPTWLKDKGDTWVTIWTELCLERQHENAVVHRHTRTGVREESAIRSIIRAIKAKLPWCGFSSRPESLDDQEDHELPNNCRQNDNDADQQMRAERALDFAQTLLLSEEEKEAMSSEGQLSDKMQNAIRNFPISAEELNILRLHFCDGLSGAAIAQCLGLAKHQPVRLIKKVLKRANEHLAEFNISL